jgi:hypothetical protein
VAWLERARRLSAADREELLALQGEGIPLSAFAVEGFVERLGRRQLIQQVRTIAATKYLE